MIALPALESIGFSSFLSAAPKLPPKRIMFMGIGYGVTSETWFPDIKDPGPNYKLPEGLKPLARHKKILPLFRDVSTNSAGKHTGEVPSG